MLTSTKAGMHILPYSGEYNSVCKGKLLLNLKTVRGTVLVNLVGILVIYSTVQDNFSK